MRRAVFLDRDGVLNHADVKNGKPYPPPTLKKCKILPGVHEALKLLRESGFLLIVVTNQPDVGRQTQTQETVEAMHQFLMKRLPLDGVEVCYDEYSSRYKPSPGMLLDAAKQYGIDLSASFMVGDRWRDVDAGRAAGCTTVFIQRHYAESLKESPDHTCGNLLEASLFILSCLC